MNPVGRTGLEKHHFVMDVSPGLSIHLKTTGHEFGWTQPKNTLF
jgi:hypothetical protein